MSVSNGLMLFFYLPLTQMNRTDFIFSISTVDKRTGTEFSLEASPVVIYPFLTFSNMM